MITNTELEYKGDLFPSKIVEFKKEVDSVYFYTDNNVILKEYDRKQTLKF